MIAGRLMLVSLIAAIIVPAAAKSQAISRDEQPAIQQALDRGQLLYAYDQAAWHGTDAMLAEAKSRGLTDALPAMIGGWIVRGAANDPIVVFFDKNAGDPKAVFVVQLSDGGQRVVSSHFVENGQNAKIDAEARLIIEARNIAVASMADTEITRCSPGSFNTVVLPPDPLSGSIIVYLLAPQDKIDEVHFGGHYRVEVSSDGKAKPAHAFTKACVDMPTSQAPNHPVALIVTQLLDPLPTEISVFTMLAAQLPLYVMTPPDGRTWSVESTGGRAQIRVVPDKQK